jgi:hypothetical protein
MQMVVVEVVRDRLGVCTPLIWLQELSQSNRVASCQVGNRCPSSSGFGQQSLKSSLKRQLVTRLVRKHA